MYKLIAILGLALLLRLYGINWDLGGHLHPDERQLIFVADRIHFFDKLNPEFFNYGTLPIYLLKGTSQLLSIFFGAALTNYDGMLYVGRGLSIIASLAIIWLIYRITLLLFKHKKTAYFASFFYSISFFTIQNSHFFIVDQFLTLCLTLLLYISLLYLKSPSIKKIVLIAAAFAAAITSKISGAIALPPLLIIFFIFPLNKKRVQSLGIFFICALLFSFIFMPYTYLAWPQFTLDIKTQLQLAKNAYAFPYTLQYVGTLPYLYYLKNIILWGLGPFISTLSIVGMFVYFNLLKKDKSTYKLHIFTITLYALYFLYIGQSAVKFMRYMLPMYPFFAILAAIASDRLLSSKKIPVKFFFYTLAVCTIVWTLAFVNIYSSQHTRLAATDWIIKNIPAGSTLAVEHWDDRLAGNRMDLYRFEELTLYDIPDDSAKWNILDGKLARSDYIIIASNRLYVPLQRLTDCTKYKVCYPRTARYYPDLFGGKLSFHKVAEFAAPPSIFGIRIDDLGADESFTVYDHPKIMIFKKNDKAQ